MDNDVLSVVRLLPLNRRVFAKAVEYQKTRSLKPQDSVVYASVMMDLAKKGAGDSCFITRNPRDFANPDIRDHDLSGQGCRLLTRFTDGLGYVRANV
jgi:hypothetical protein